MVLRIDSTRILTNPTGETSLKRSLSSGQLLLYHWQYTSLLGQHHPFTFYHILFLRSRPKHNRPLRVVDVWGPDAPYSRSLTFLHISLPFTIP